MPLRPPTGYIVTQMFISRMTREESNMIIPCTQRMYLEDLSFMMVYLNKEPARLDSIFRDILDEEEAIYFSKIFIQGKRRERFQKIIINLLEEWPWRTSVSFVMEFSHRLKRRKRCSRHPESIMSISRRWNRGWKWLVNHFSLYNSICKKIFNRLAIGACDWFRYHVSVISTNRQCLREGGGGRGYKSYAINVSSGLSVLYSFLTK